MGKETDRREKDKFSLFNSGRVILAYMHNMHFALVFFAYCMNEKLRSIAANATEFDAII